MTERTLFTPADVFISWNHRDRELKNKLVSLLRSAGFSVWESDYECSGSIKEVCLGHIPLCKTFLILLTPNSLGSAWVREELETAIAMEDGVNRIIPVVMDASIIEQKQYGAMASTLSGLFDNPDDAANVSAVLPTGLTDEAFSQKLLKNVTDLCRNRSFRVYRQNLQRFHMNLPILVNVGRIPAGDLRRLYIPRRLREATPTGQHTELTEADFLRRRDCGVIIGSGGSGKSQYLRHMASLACRVTDHAVFLLPCAATVRSGGSLTDQLFREFRSISGDESYARLHFDALLSHCKDRILVLLDGLDEVLQNADHERLRQMVQVFLNIYPQARVIFTTRNQADADRMMLSGHIPAQFHLEHFSEDDIQRYSRQLFLAFGDEAGGDRFYMDLASIDAEIKGNPLLVSQLAVIYADSGKLPGTVVEIFDLITELVTTGIDSLHDFSAGLTESDRDLVERIPLVLRELAYRKYRKAADEETADNLGLVSDILERQLGMAQGDCRIKAKQILHYLDRRAILYRNEFAHKMFQEYFTAVYLYETFFNGAGELRDPAALREYFRRHYNQRYWENVTVLLLSKADCLCALTGLDALYAVACDACGGDYALLLRPLRLQRRRERIAGLLLQDMLSRTLDGTYGPYCQWFCYVPREKLYREAVHAAAALWPRLEDSRRLIVLSLLRDVCFIFGGHSRLETVAERKLLRPFQLFCRNLPPSPRAALNALFCGATPAWLDAFLAEQTGSRVHPWFFNVHAVATGDGSGFGSYLLDEPFRDELDLYGETQPDADGCYRGLVTMPLDSDLLQQELTPEYAGDMTGLVLLPYARETLETLPIANARLELLVLPGSLRALGKYSLAYYGLASPNGIRIQISFGPEQLHPGHGLQYAGTVSHLFLPDSLTDLPDAVFSGCGNLRTVRLPATITRIGEEAFADCVCLHQLAIPDSVTTIGSSAFDGCDSLTHVHLPHGLSHIAAYAFSNCKQLAEVTLPAGLRQLGTAAFQFCGSLKSVRIPEGVTRLESTTFIECTSLEQVTLPETLEYLGSECFRGCSALQSISLPDALTEIGSTAFMLCDSLARVRFGSKLQSIGASAFCNCSRLEEVILPDSITKIGTYAFSGCTDMTELRLPASLRFIDIETFSTCTALRSVEIPAAVRSIWSGAFGGCSALETLTLSEGLNTIYEMAFARCTALQAVTIPDSVREIGNAAFYGCEALASIRVPDHTMVAPSAFEECPVVPEERPPLEDFITLLFGDHETYQEFLSMRDSVETIVIDGTHCPGGILTRDDVLRAVPPFLDCRLRIGTGIRRICENAFASSSIPRDQRKITQITLDAGVTQIDPGAFAECRYLNQIVLPPTMTTLPERLFRGCARLASVSLPPQLTHIGPQAFFCCSDLAELTLPDTVIDLGQDAFRGSGMKTFRVPTGVTCLPKGLFAACSSLKAVELPDGLREIGEEAFAGCKNLASVNWPRYLERLERNAFFSCESLTHAMLPPSLQTLGSGVFSGCRQLKTLTLPSDLPLIPDSAFQNCSHLREIHIPDSVAAIGSNAFCQCRSLTEVAVPGRISRLTDAVFFECDGLRTVILESGVTCLGSQVFEGCTALEQISLPDTVTELENRAFAECKNLARITLSPGLTTIGDEAFIRCDSLREIRIPDSTLFISPSAFRECRLRCVSLPARFRDKVETVFGAFHRISDEEDPARILVEF